MYVLYVYLEFVDANSAGVSRHCQDSEEIQILEVSDMTLFLFVYHDL